MRLLLFWWMARTLVIVGRLLTSERMLSRALKQESRGSDVVCLALFVRVSDLVKLNCLGIKVLSKVELVYLLGMVGVLW